MSAQLEARRSPDLFQALGRQPLKRTAPTATSRLASILDDASPMP